MVRFWFGTNFDLVVEPGDDDIAYNYPNPFSHSTTFQFFMDTTKSARFTY